MRAEARAVTVARHAGSVELGRDERRRARTDGRPRDVIDDWLGNAHPTFDLRSALRTWWPSGVGGTSANKLDLATPYPAKHGLTLDPNDGNGPPEGKCASRRWADLVERPSGGSRRARLGGPSVPLRGAGRLRARRRFDYSATLVVVVTDRFHDELAHHAARVMQETAVRDRTLDLPDREGEGRVRHRQEAGVEHVGLVQGHAPDDTG